MNFVIWNAGLSASFITMLLWRCGLQGLTCAIKMNCCMYNTGSPTNWKRSCDRSIIRQISYNLVPRALVTLIQWRNGQPTAAINPFIISRDPLKQWSPESEREIRPQHRPNSPPYSYQTMSWVLHQPLHVNTGIWVTIERTQDVIIWAELKFFMQSQHNLSDYIAIITVNSRLVDTLTCY